MKKLLTIFLLFGIAQAQTTYFVSNSGNDGNSGLYGSPWHTAAKATATVTAGGTVLFEKGGFWNEPLIPQNSGTASSPIRFGSYGSGARPIISGGEVESGFTPTAGHPGLFEKVCTNTQGHIRVLTIDGTPYSKGRFPNANNIDGGFIIVDSYTEPSPSAKTLTAAALAPVTSWVGAEVVGKVEQYVTNTYPITNKSGSTITYDVTHEDYINHGDRGEPIPNTRGFFLQNHIDYCDQYGDWSYDSTTKKLYVFFGSESPFAHNVIASWIDNLVTINHRDYVEFDSLQFTSAQVRGFYIQNSNHITLNGVDVNSIGATGVSAETNINYLNIFNTSIHDILSNGVIIGTFNSIDFVSGGGMVNASNHCLFEDVTVNNVGMIDGLAVNGVFSGQGFEINGNNNTARRFKVTNIGYHGMRFTGYDLLCENGVIDGSCLKKNDGAAVYSWNNLSPYNPAYTNRVFRNIVIRNAYGNYFGTEADYHGAGGFYADDNTGGVTLEHCVIENAPGHGVILHNSPNCIINNCTLYDVGNLATAQATSTNIVLTHDNLVPVEHAMTGIQITNNRFISTHLKNEVLRIEGRSKADILGFATFSNNVFSRPVGETDKLIQIGFADTTDGLKNVKYNCGIDAFKTMFGDATSALSPINTKWYNVTSVVDPNVYNGGSGAINMSGATAHSSYGNLSISSDATKLDGTSLKVNITSPHVTAPVNGGTFYDGALLDLPPLSEADTYYLVNLSVVGNVLNKPIQLRLRYGSNITDNSNNYSDDTYNATIKTNRTEEEGIFFGLRNPSDVYLELSSTDEHDSPYWIDNLHIKQVNITARNPYSYVRFEDNPSSSPVNVSLDKTYRLIDGTTVSGSVTVPAWSGVALYDLSGSLITTNNAPFVNAGVDQTGNYLTTSTTLNGTASDADGTVSTTLWTQTSGTTATISSPSALSTSITGLTPGTRVFRLTATDNNGAVTYDEVTININANTAPVANAGADQFLNTNTTILNGTGSDAETSVTYSWTRVSGPNTPTITSPTSAMTGISGLIDGNYVFAFTVSDGALSTTDNITVQVNTSVTAVYPHVFRGHKVYYANGVVIDTTIISAPVGGSIGEFVGPFASWDTLSATGDSSLDRIHLNAHLAVDGTLGHPNVLYLMGHFKTDQQLYVQAVQNLRILGIHPDSTSITYVGPAGYDIFFFNGISDCEVSRMTLDGNGLTGSIIYQAWDGFTGFFDTGNQYADNVFKNSIYGLNIGDLGNGGAETSILRNKFINMQRPIPSDKGHDAAGVVVKNFNALDTWVWDCYFDSCFIAISNNFGHGNFHAYRDIFKHSTVSDLFIHDVDGFSARECYSYQSNRFWTGGVTSNSAQIILQNNTVVDGGGWVQNENSGPLTSIDNVVKLRPGVSYAYYSNYELTTIGDTYNVAYATSPITGSDARNLYINDIFNANLNLSVPAFVGFQPNYHRQIFEVSDGASSATVQAAIDAANAAGNKSVVHLPKGGYNLDVTNNGDAQITGDGFATLITGKITLSNKASLSNGQMYGNNGEAIVINNADQVGAKVFMQGINAENNGISVYQEGTNNLQTSITNSSLHYNFSGTGVGLKVSGGNALAASKVVVCGAEGSVSGPQFQLSNGGKAIVYDYWRESETTDPLIDATGSGSITFNGLREHSLMNQTQPVVRTTSFNGNLTFVSTAVDDRMSLEGDGTNTKVLVLGNKWGTGSQHIVNTSGADARVFINREQTDGSNGTGSLTVVDAGSLVPSFITNMLSDTRATRIPKLTDTNAGVTDVRLFRIRISNCSTAIHLKP